MHVTFDITTDVVCIWCYIGMHRLERALAARPDVTADITFHPFELSPELDMAGMDRAAFVAKKFGAEQWKVMEARLVATATKDQLPLNYGKILRRPNTRLAHVLMSRATETGHGAALHRALTAAYFGDGEDIGQAPVLVRIAQSIGMDANDATEALNDEERTRAVILRADAARQRGVQGVPFFVINGRYAISGAQETDDWLNVLAQLAAA